LNLNAERKDKPMKSVLFDDLADVYEAMINWPKRLAHEEPFFRRVFAEVGARSVIDVACGSGRHAAMFHSWGLRVEAADISRVMLERAKSNFGEPPGLRWLVRGFDEPIESEEPFDAALCIGNSLALAADVETAGRAIGRMTEAVRPGGAVVLHVLNVWQLPEGPVTWQKCVRGTLPQGDVTIVKGASRSGNRGFVQLVVTTCEDEPSLAAESVPFLGLESGQLEEMLRGAGADRVQCFGDYRRGPYERNQSVDLIVVARK
jgi:glycine/sarcosine N-methyltransferase